MLKSDRSLPDGGRIWREPTAPLDAAEALAAELKLPPLAARLLAARGFREPAAVRNFLQPRLSNLSDPMTLPGMPTAVERIWRAVKSRRPIAVYGDYDVDGLTATALLVRLLRKLGASKVEPFLPHRMDDGYGLGVEPVERCIEEIQPGLLITVDCGTGSVEAVERARALGVEVVVTDHHALPDRLAPAAALVNPHLAQEPNAAALAGVGVAFKLGHALLKVGREAGRTVAEECDLREYLDLVALGTVADVVPLLGENRIFVRHGLERLRETQFIGLRALREDAGLRGEIDAWHIGFVLGPRLNAAGRLGAANTALDLLLTDNPDVAMNLVRTLNANNKERQEIERATEQEAKEVVEADFDPARDFGLVVAGEGWHPGVLGLVASRLSNHYRRPAVVVAWDENGKGRGSGRSIEAFPLLQGLVECATWLEAYGGHAMAAGVSIRREQFDGFRRRFNAVAAEVLRGVDLRPVQPVDAWVDLADLNDELWEALRGLRPFGAGHAEPVWAVRGAEIDDVRVVGKDHLKLRAFANGVEMDAIGFGMAGRALPNGVVDLAFHLRENTYRGRRSLQLQLCDFRDSTAEEEGGLRAALPSS